MLDGGVELRLRPPHPVNQTARRVVVLSRRLQRIQTADDDVHRRAARVGQTARRFAGVGFRLLHQVVLVGVVLHQAEELVGRDQHLVVEGAHVLVELVVVLAQHAEVLGLHQPRRHAPAGEALLDDPLAAHQADVDRLAQHRVGVAAPVLVADVRRRRASLGLVDHGRIVGIADVEAQRNGAEQQGFEVVERHPQLVVHRRRRRVRRAGVDVVLIEHAAVHARLTRRHAMRSGFADELCQAPGFARYPHFYTIL